MAKKDDPAFNQKLLRRFINLIGMFPVGSLVRLNTEEIGVVTHEHPTDPFRPQVKIVRDRDGGAIEEPPLVNTWEPDGRGDFTLGGGRGRRSGSVEHRSAGVHVTRWQTSAPRSTTRMALRLAEFARACKAALRAVSLYPAGASRDRLDARAG